MASIEIDNTYALTLKTLHKPGNPLVLANIYDPPSTTTLLSLNNDKSSPPLVKAAATTSYAIASKLSIPDEALTLSQNLDAIAAISPIVRAAGLPLTVDLQDGYGDQIVEAIKGIISHGAVGANIEDSYPEKGFGDGIACLRTVEEAADRIRLAMKTAKDMGLPDFVINARTDTLCLKPRPEGWSRERLVDETVKRGEAYLDAGATSVFVWGGPAGLISDEEVKILVEQFQGRLAVKLANGREGLSVKELADLGVCRISIGPGLLSKDADGLRKNALRILNGGQFWSAEQ